MAGSASAVLLRGNGDSRGRSLPRSRPGGPRDRFGDQGFASVAAGGRVLGITALGETVENARVRAYEAVAQIRFDGAQFRKDIAAADRVAV